MLTCKDKDIDPTHKRGDQECGRRAAHSALLALLEAGDTDYRGLVDPVTAVNTLSSTCRESKFMRKIPSLVFAPASPYKWPGKRPPLLDAECVVVEGDSARRARARTRTRHRTSYDCNHRLKKACRCADRVLEVAAVGAC
jgi:hypothetical protein